MTFGHVGADESRKGGVSVLGVILRVCKVLDAIFSLTLYLQLDSNNTLLALCRGLDTKTLCWTAP